MCAVQYVVLGSVELHNVGDVGPADGTGVPALHQHPAAVGAGAEVLAGTQHARAAAVHADDALQGQGGRGGG